MPTRILVKTTIGPVADDCHVGRFSLLTEHLRSLKDSASGVLYDIVARDRNGNQNGDDTDLLQLASFVNEPAGEGVLSSPDALDDGHRYVENIASWLAGRV